MPVYRYRVVTADDSGEIFEVEQSAFFEAVRNSYLQRAAADPQRYHVIDASGSLEQVAAQMQLMVARVLERWHA